MWHDMTEASSSGRVLRVCLLDIAVGCARWLNRLRCRLGRELEWAHGRNRVLIGGPGHPGEEAILGKGHVPAHCKYKEYPVTSVIQSYSLGGSY